MAAQILTLVKRQSSVPQALRAASPSPAIRNEFYEVDRLGCYTVGEFLGMVFTEGEPILHGLHKGEIGIINGMPNAGKSTLALNTCLALACGRPFPPLVPYDGKPRRVLYLDFENTPRRLQSDLFVMAQALPPKEREVACDNFAVIVGAELNNETLTITNQEHLRQIARETAEHRADLLVIDTLASATSLYDENSNAEIQRKVLTPLRKICRLTGCAALIIDHKGKKGLDAVGGETPLYAGRGASAKACAARVIYNLDADPKAENVSLLSNPKIKGDKFQSVLMKLDSNRWFSAIGKSAAREQSNYEAVVSFVLAEARPVKRSEVIEKFAAVISKPTVERALRDAIGREVLRLTKRGMYEAVVNEGQ
ncbi:MAG: hypothetical protein AUG51_07750 [Acidobacteria bacterium 13_1_20CM_3_53_8]|nr:MAG: hypothetical protein AUG51_07750 [Acidobacteria bacterium 13_1_20CM_3_53_8]